MKEVIYLKRKKVKRKMLIISIIYLVFGITLLDNVGKTMYQIYQKSKEKKDFETQLVELKEKEEELKATVTKLQDPDYVARYAREKYLYSKDGEIIIRIPD